MKIGKKKKKKRNKLENKIFQIHSPFKVHLILNSLCFQGQNEVYLCVIYRVQTVKLRAQQVKGSFVYVLQLTHIRKSSTQTKDSHDRENTIKLKTLGPKTIL